jgi:dTDP-4-amino-4,6-dideoxygalactose transaminase
MDPSSYKNVIEDTLSKNKDRKIKASIPIHLFGQCADMPQILSISSDFNIKVIEDAAQSIGADCPFPNEVKRAGCMGDMSIFSFFPSKNLGGYGDGGMVLTPDKNLADKLKKLRFHGSSDKYFYDLVGGNFRLDALQAAILRIKLSHLDDWHAKRQANAGHYDRIFQETGLIDQGKIKTPVPVYKNTGVKNYHTYNQYVIRAERRDELQTHLKEKGIGTAVYYPLSLHLQKCFESLGYKMGDFPHSERASKEVLALPVYPELTRDMQDHVVACVTDFYGR